MWTTDKVAGRPRGPFGWSPNVTSAKRHGNRDSPPSWHPYGVSRCHREVDTDRSRRRWGPNPRSQFDPSSRARVALKSGPFRRPISHAHVADQGSLSTALLTLGGGEPRGSTISAVPSVPALTWADRAAEKQRDEAHLPAEQPPSCPQARLPAPDVDACGSRHHRVAPPQGPRGAVRLTPVRRCCRAGIGSVTAPTSRRRPEVDALAARCSLSTSSPRRVARAHRRGWGWWCRKRWAMRSPEIGLNADYGL